MTSKPKSEGTASAKQHTVVFENRNGSWTVQVEHNTSLLEAARACGAPVQTLCNGIGACVQCKVRVKTKPEHLSPPEQLERDLIGNIFHITQERLGCQACVLGDVTVEPLPARLPKKRRVKLRGPIR